MSLDPTVSQNENILAALKGGESLTPLDALRRFGCFRLGARIYDLKQDGHEIGGRFVKVMNAEGKEVRVKEYFMEPSHARREVA